MQILNSYASIWTFSWCVWRAIKLGAYLDLPEEAALARWHVLLWWERDPTSAWPNRWKNCTFLDGIVGLKFCWNFAFSLMLFLSNRRAVWELESIPRHIWPTTDASVLMWVVLLCFGLFHWLINWFGPDQTVWSEKELKQQKKNATMSIFFFCFWSGPKWGTDGKASIIYLLLVLLFQSVLVDLHESFRTPSPFVVIAFWPHTHHARPRGNPPGKITFALRSIFLFFPFLNYPDWLPRTFTTSSNTFKFYFLASGSALRQADNKV